ncbi:energy transducer TonB [Novosphingobium beihaiensis]|uniref:Energy transducer TonB n=1 Tax=Novosphingobium beihaiensis TaxID=2930389 RepID=A0ABT0BRN7_9SPHN|nr:energy transducer TonB [Novosphingobium beihaiensis]MCJ2187304.1 energy transducer TonB [Novosphingobium beihaiensis]
MLSLMLLAAAAATTAAPAETKAPTLQQRFDTATDLALSEKCAEAVPQFEALERNPQVKPGTLPAAAIAVRKGVCLAKLGRHDEGERAIALGLPVLQKAGPQFDADVSEALQMLGVLAYARSDYPRAKHYLQMALEKRKGPARLTILSRLAKVTAFDGDAAALEPAAEGLRILSAQKEPNKDTLAAFHTLHARVLLNQGKSEEAYTELKQALSLSGGLSLRTTLNEVSLRSDLAMAAMLTGKTDAARKYLAYTGAGRFEEASFTKGKSMTPPLCGTETGLRPDDVAVVEFGIGEDGYVTNAHTVYSRGGPQVAAAFERAVSQWYWDPQDAAKIPAFYRLLTRIELRCSTAFADRPGLWSPLNGRFQTWAAKQLPAGTQGIPDRATMLETLHRLASDESGTAHARIAALGMLFAHDTIAPVTQRTGWIDTALSLAGTGPIPVEQANWLRISRQVALAKEDGRMSDRTREALLALAQQPEIAGDPLAADTLRLYAAGTSIKQKLKQSDEVIGEVAHDDRLDAHHPLRQIAWMTLANKAAKDGDLAAAKANFQKTGLTEEQCALLSLPPAIRRTNVGYGDYPQSAAAMGFEGWVQLEYDIGADGNTANVRPVIAYPALIFVKAAQAIGENVKYEWSYRPGGATACSANSNTIIFHM